MIIDGMEVKHISTGQAAILRRLAKGPIPGPELRKLDQRPLRGLFLQGAFSLDRQLNGEITKVGWDAIKRMTGRPPQRSNTNRPVFIDSMPEGHILWPRRRAKHA